MAIHPHTLFLLYAHGDQLTHRPFFLLSLIGHIIHHHDVLANAAPPIILSCHQLENKSTSVRLRRPFELRLHMFQVGFSIFRIRNSSPDCIAYGLLHKHERHAVTPSPLFMS
ncbi:hypothetical protein Hanom_Chr07g00622231 [Helianthus anomalus]